MSNRWQCMNCGYIHKGSAPPASCPSCGAPFTAFVRYEKDPKARFKSVQIAEKRPPGFRYVIIGNSAAGRSAARAINALDPKGKLTVISEEDAPFYVRPLLPDFIGGMPRNDFLGVGSLFGLKGLNVLRGQRAESLDLAGKQVLCAGGKAVAYDMLLLATGSAPLQVPWPGSEAEGIAYFRTFADAERIAGLAKGAKHAVVVGGGLLGLEFVRAFLAAGLQVTQLVRGREVGSPALDEQGGAIIEKALGDLGVELGLEEEVESFEAREGRVCGVKTTKGRTIACDLVGIAIGVRPRVELAKDAGITLDRGVLVDRQFRSSAAEVYAAGDVAQAYDQVWQQPRVNTSWRNSQEQGEAAGIAMVGGAVEYPGAVGANFQLAAGLPFCAIGIVDPPAPEGYEVSRAVDPEKQTFKKTVERSGVLVGASLIGDLSEAGGLEEQIRAGSGASGATAAPAGALVAPVTETVKPSGGEPQQERMSGMHKMTENNLKDAFAGESQAHMKYLNFADKAVEDGKENVARVFRAASFSEQMHASRHLEVLEGVGSTGENIAGAMGGEGFEVDEMYPAYIAVAIEQDEPGAQESMVHAFETEKVHHALYERAKDAVDEGGDVVVDTLWVCNYCGFTMEGEPPDKCPLCKNPKKNFVKF